MNKVLLSRINYSVCIFLSLFIFLISFSSAAEFGWNNLDNEPDINYSLVPTVNNSDLLQGLTPQEVADLYVETDSLAYNGTLAYNSSLINYNSTGWILNWSQIIQPFNLQEILNAGNTANISIVIENTETDAYCQGSPNDASCYNNYFTQGDCEAYTGHNSQCMWLPFGECQGDIFSYCYYNYLDESSCNGDIYGACYWAGSECYPILDCYYDYYDESSCNSAVGGGICSWTDYSYCENQAELTCSQVGETECDAVAGCSFETDIDYTTITTGQFNSTATTGLAPMVVSSTTKVDNLNADLLDGYSSNNFLLSTTTGLTLPALSNGKFLKSGASAVSWETAVEGTYNLGGGSQLGGFQQFASWSTASTITGARQPNNGGATIGHSDINGNHWIYAKLDNSYLGGFGIGSSGFGAVGIGSSAGAILASWNFNPAGTISTGNSVSMTGGASTTTLTATTSVVTPSLNAQTINGTIIADRGTLGAEKLNNPNFDANANYWDLTGGWSYASSRLSTTSSGTVYQAPENMSTTLELDKVYRLSFGLSIYGAGTSSVVTFCGNTIGTYASSVSTATDNLVVCKNISDGFKVVTTNGIGELIRLDTISIKEIGQANLIVLGNTTLNNLQVLGNFTAPNVCYSNGTNCNTTDYNSTGLILNWSEEIPSPDVSGLVPYTGATGDVDLGSHSIYNTMFNLGTSAIQILNLDFGWQNLIYTDGDMDYFGRGKPILLDDGEEGVYGGSFISSVATGTAPYQCTSTTLNTNLNADLLDGQHSTDFCLANGTNCVVSETNWTNVSANYVSYTGATGNVDLGAYGLNATEINTTSMKANSIKMEVQDCSTIACQSFCYNGTLMFNLTTC